MEHLEMFAPVQGDGYVDITLPVAINTMWCALEIRITPSDDTYRLESILDMFEDANDGAQFYFDIFEKHDKNYHYGILLDDSVFYKEYENDYNLSRALDEFIRFFILLDDFIIKNNVIGHEEDFQ
jgi:hypothetical protein